jgi:hypothetical protein
MSGLDANGQITVLKYSLAKAQDLFTDYQQLLGNQGGSLTNSKILSSQKVDLQNELTNLTAEADTLNTEFRDRSSVSKPSKLAAWGLASKQDWIFLIFFSSYGIACLVAVLYTVIYVEQKMTGAFVVILCTVVLGIMIGGLLKYFA